MELVVTAWLAELGTKAYAPGYSMAVAHKPERVSVKVVITVEVCGETEYQLNHVIGTLGWGLYICGVGSSASARWLWPKQARTPAGYSRSGILANECRVRKLF